MRHLPISLDLRNRRIVVAGAGETALAKLRILLKTEADIVVFGATPAPETERLSRAGRCRLVRRPIVASDLAGATLLYAAHGDAAADARAVALARSEGVLCNAVDDLEASDFLTPAIVDRDPVTVAIGTEGTAPMLARLLKREFEERLPSDLGLLARLAGGFRRRAATLRNADARRRFWRRFFLERRPVQARGGRPGDAVAALDDLLEAVRNETAPAGHVYLVGAGPGDPELMTLKARRLLDEADVVIHDRLASAGALELARREARIVSVGKQPGGPSWRQEDINALLVAEAAAGAQVVRLKCGDPAVFGRLDEEIDALEAAGVAYSVVPGVTAATAAAASAGASLTRRCRNADLRILTGHDVDGFAEQDWRALAKPGAAAAIYMGVAAAKFLQGRLLMHGADPATPVAVVENASLPGETILSARLGDLSGEMAAFGVRGPAILLFGVAARRHDAGVAAAAAVAGASQ